MTLESVKKPASPARGAAHRPFSGPRRAANGMMRGVDAHGPPSALGSLPTGWIASSASRGLDPKERQRIAPVLGSVADDINIHEDTPARAMTSELAADAFTLGNDIYLSRRESHTGGLSLRLLAHEAAHVGQRSNASHAWIQRSPDGTSPSPFDPAQHYRYSFDLMLREAPANKA